jgi:hypothetical protein
MNILENKEGNISFVELVLGQSMMSGSKGVNCLITRHWMFGRRMVFCSRIGVS